MGVQRLEHATCVLERNPEGFSPAVESELVDQTSGRFSPKVGRNRGGVSLAFEQKRFSIHLLGWQGLGSRVNW